MMARGTNHTVTPNDFAASASNEVGPSGGDRFLKLGDVQRMLGISRSTVWRWQAEHGLKVVRVGGVTRIRESDLNAFLERHAVGATGQATPERV